MEPGARCPCMSGLAYGECCGPLHAGERAAPTAEALMRSRFSAYAVGEAAYLLDTWHSTTRPASLDLDPTVRWTRLDVEATTAGGPFDREGTVRFSAWWRTDADRGVQHETSTFLRDDRWRYVDGV